MKKMNKIILDEAGGSGGFIFILDGSVLLSSADTVMHIQLCMLVHCVTYTTVVSLMEKLIKWYIIENVIGIAQLIWSTWRRLHEEDKRS